MEDKSARCPDGLPEVSTKEYDYWQVQNIRSGQAECWQALYQDAYGAVFWCAKKADGEKLFENYEYRDIVDEAFALCFAQLDRYQGWSRFRWWVGGYAKNITRNRCARERTRRKHLGAMTAAAAQRMTAGDPVRMLIRRERNQCLWRAFSAIDTTDQAILTRRILENRSFSSIARELRLTRKEVLRRYGSSVVDVRMHFVQAYCGGASTEASNNIVADWSSI